MALRGWPERLQQGQPQPLQPQQLLSACLENDVIALDAAQWQEHRHSRDPHWRGSTREAIRLVPVEAAAPVR